MTAPIEDRPHYVYRHYDKQDRLIYVGMTSRPDIRPTESRKRAWLATSARYEVSPPMSREAAAWVERATIIGEKPKYNERVTGEWVGQDEDWRIARFREAFGCNKTTARSLVSHLPRDPDAFEAFLSARLAAELESTERAS